MKSFKQFLKLQESALQSPPEGFEYVSPPSTKKPQQTIQPKVEDGYYTITAREALIRRLGSKEEADKYLQQLKQRRETNPLQGPWVLPSLSDEDLDRPIQVKISPFQELATKKLLGFYNAKATPNAEGDIVKTSWATKKNPIMINSNEYVRSTFPLNQNLYQISSELKSGQIPKSETTVTDTLWHELQHVLQNPTFLGKNQKAFTDVGGMVLNPESIHPGKEQSDMYVTQYKEIAPHVSEAKSLFRSQRNKNLGPNMTPQEFGEFKSFLKGLGKSSSMNSLYDFFTNPKTSKDAEEMLRQVVKRNEASDVGYA